MNNLNNIDITSIIKKQNLDERNYFKSLINEACRLNLLTSNDMSVLQFQLLELLDKRVYNYNGLDSSSIRKEILDEISVSNIYTISIYLKKFGNPDNEIKWIKENSLMVSYENGLKQIYKMIDIIRLLYIRVKQSHINVGNDTYNSTIFDGIKGFLKIYNPEFAAQDMKITADYPLFNNLIGKLDGVEFILEYLNSVFLENKFCSLFSEDKIIFLLKTYSDNYKYLIINIFEIVLFQVFACKLANQNIQSLTISQYDLNKIYENLNTEIINITVLNAYNEIKKELSLGEEVQTYIEKNFDYIKTVIDMSFNQKTLEKIFITEKFILK